MDSVVGKCGKTSGTGGNSSESSDEDQEEPSSSFIQKQNVEDELENFRDKWKKELGLYKSKQENLLKEQLKLEDAESVAKKLFLSGAEMERAGQLYEAIQFYKRAVQLVPDIEFRLDTKTKKPKVSKETMTEIINIRGKSEKDNNDIRDENNDVKDLYGHIQKKISKNRYICAPVNDQKLTHISALPLEIILYILRWVVSSEVDMRSLEVCSLVCRGFYLCCRDSEIWRLACVRTWGLNVDLPRTCISWRQMYIERARLCFNGCYIGKTTYIRSGENSFQDQFYRPWHIVAYYRYLRFFPDGLVLMLTSSDEPSVCVGQLKYRSYKNPTILSGHYRLRDDRVTIIAYRNDSLMNSSIFKSRSKIKDPIHDSRETFHLDMQIQDYKKQRHIRLVWTGYSVYTRHKNGTESTCEFDLKGNKFPPLWFSRVKSYTAESYNPL
ncbi:hypothetical protein RN001_007018 [Aquatica leii]|uniref:F-box only protein 9 n=1 Tax=Aquatica leii TaxID=1421715 RepID=A0AAN7Q2G7_9COLE|nr:hypothetical protein RN001_007018 [Aquatica leii]